MERKGHQCNVKVLVRVRPFNQKELNEAAGDLADVCDLEPMSNTSIAIKPPPQYTDHKSEAFAFDNVFWSIPADQLPACIGFATQEDVYREVGVPALDSAFEGYNGCIFAYGQTSSGKTYTMMGYDGHPGVTPRLCQELFARIEERAHGNKDSVKIHVEMTYLEIYNEKIRDLLGEKKSPVKVGKDKPMYSLDVRQDPKKGPVVPGLTKHDILSWKQVNTLLDKGSSKRAVLSTSMNDTSSRSHAVVQLIMVIEEILGKVGSKVVSKTRTSRVNLVDLAGSEKIEKSKVSGSGLEEAININMSLTTLGRVIDALIENHHHVPYRDSTLTRLLSDSLGGNSKTMMLATLSPAPENYDETMSTLRYAARARKIINIVKVNEDASAALINDLKAELARLKGGGIGGMAGRGGAASAQYEEMMKKLKQREAQQEAAAAEAEAKLQSERKHIEEEHKNMMADFEARMAEHKEQLDEEKSKRIAASFRQLGKIARVQEAAKTAQDNLETERQRLEGLKGQMEEDKRKRAVERWKGYSAAVRFQTKVKELESALSKEQLASTNKDTDINGLKERLNSLEASLSEAKRQQATLQDDLKTRADKVLKLTSDSTHKDEQILGLQDEVAEVHSKVEQLQQSLKDCHKSCSDLDTQNTANARNVNQLEQQLATKTRECDTERSLVAQATDKSSQLEAELRKKKTEHTRVTQRSQARMEELEAELQQSTNKIKQLEQSVQDTSTACAQQEADMQANITHLQEQLSAKVRELATVEAEKEQLVEDLEDRLTSDKRECQHNLSQRDTAISELEGTVHKLKQQIKKLERQVADLLSEKADLTSKLRERDDRIAILENDKRKRSAQLSDTIKTKDQQIRDMEDELKKVRQARNQCDTQNEELVDELGLLQNTVRQKDVAIRELENSLRTAANDAATASRTTDAQLQKIEQEKAAKEKECTSLLSDKDDMIASLQRKLKAAHAQLDRELNNKSPQMESAETVRLLRERDLQADADREKLLWQLQEKENEISLLQADAARTTKAQQALQEEVDEYRVCNDNKDLSRVREQQVQQRNNLLEARVDELDRLLRDEARVRQATERELSSERSRSTVHEDMLNQFGALLATQKSKDARISALEAEVRIQTELKDSAERERQTALDRMEGQIRKLSASPQLQQGTRSQQQSPIERASPTAHTLATATATLEAEVTRLHGALVKVECNRDDIALKCNRLSDECSTLKGRLDQLQTDHTSSMSNWAQVSTTQKFEAHKDFEDHILQLQRDYESREAHMRSEFHIKLRTVEAQLQLVLEELDKTDRAASIHDIIQNVGHDATAAVPVVLASNKSSSPRSPPPMTSIGGPRVLLEPTSVTIQDSTGRRSPIARTSSPLRSSVITQSGIGSFLLPTSTTAAQPW